MPTANYRRVTFVTGTGELRGRGRRAWLAGELLVVADDRGGVTVVAEGRPEADDLRIADAQRSGEALLWSNARGETLAVVGTVHAYDADAPRWLAEDRR